ncbi:MAG: LysR family transcriptional regulator [Clostridia bacterium]
MNINFEYYRVFYVVANSHTITDASKKLCITQPAVTKTIQNLESQLKGILFIRNKNGIKLTEEGKIFYNCIRPAIEQIYNAEKEFTNISKLDVGNIKIGTSNTILKYYLMKYLKNYSQKFPHINIAIEESYTPSLINMVKNGTLDLAIIYASDVDHKLDGLKIYNLKKLNYCLIGNEKYKKYSKNKVSYSDIKHENLILNTINPIQTNLLEDEEDSEAHINLASHSLVYEFAKNGFGIGVAIKEFIKDDLENESLYEIKLKENFQPLNLIMITSKTNFPNYATSELIHLINDNQKKEN